MKDARIGERISHFTLAARLGAGGMGEVYQARDERLRREVAVKVVRGDHFANPDMHRRLLREARAAASISHPNVTAIYEVGDTAEESFIVMELVRGRTLRSLLVERALSVRECTSIAVQMADALAAAHEADVIHRDLKPENVIVDDIGRVKILDFGLAKLERPASTDDEAHTATAQLTSEGALIGTVAYMSPEQCRCEALEHRSDLFAFGAVLFEILTRQKPFCGATMADLLCSILGSEPPAPSTVNSEVGPELDALVLRMLAKSPSDRPASAAAVLAELRELERATRASLVVAPQHKMCVCGRSKTFPICDGRHETEGWTCAVDTHHAELGFFATRRYQNLARKLASHHSAALCDGPSAPAVDRLVVIVDGADLESAVVALKRIVARERIVVTLGVAAPLLARWFADSVLVDLSDIDPLHAFGQLNALLARGEWPRDVAAAPARRSCFISHAVADEPLLIPIKSYMERFYALDLFTCADSIRPGSDWHGSILQALRDNDLFVLLLSEASLRSHFCSFEVGAAVALGKPIAVISIDGSAPPAFIQHVQAIDIARIRRQKPWLDIHDVLVDELLAVVHPT